MNKTIYICSDDAEYRAYVEDKIREVEKNSTVIHCETQGILYRKIRKFEGVYIICDKLFLGLMLRQKLVFIRSFLNGTAKIMITAWQTEEFFFGVRIKNLGFDGFLNRIGNDENFTHGIKEFLDKGVYFDEVTEKEYLNKTLNSHARYVSDVVTEEIDAVLKVRGIGNAKSSNAGSSDSTVYNRISNFKRKMGVVTDEELDRIIQQIKNGGLF